MDELVLPQDSGQNPANQIGKAEVPFGNRVLLLVYPQQKD